MYALPILLAVAFLTTDDAVNARLASLPQACQAQATEESDTTGSLHGLVQYKIEPLCAKYPQPNSGDYLLRYTTRTRSGFRSQTEFQAHQGHLKVVVDDNLYFDPPYGHRLTTTMSAGAFHRALDRAGLAQLWDASDECPPTDEIFNMDGSLWSTWEFYDHSGYRIRDQPPLQACETPYARIHKELVELVRDLEGKSRLVSTFTPPMPKEE